MKTTNKVLLATFVIGLVFITYLIIKISSFVSIDAQEPSGISEVKNYEIESFNRLVVKKGMEVLLIQDSTESLLIKSDSAFMKFFELENNKGELKMGVSKNMKDNLKIMAELHVKTLNTLRVSGGSNIKSEKMFAADSLKLTAGAGSSVKMDMSLNYLDCKATSGAVVKLSGKSTAAKIKANSGAKIRAGGLITESATAETSSGGRIYLIVNETLGVKASSGGVVEYSGSPQISYMEVNSGGQLRKKK